MSFKIDETVGYNLRAFRLKNNLTQQALADRANLSKQTISNIEKGQGANSKTVERLAECLDVSSLSFYKENELTENIQFKRVSATTGKNNNTSYTEQLEKLVDIIIQDTKGDLYYQEVMPAVKSFFNQNADNILERFDVEKSNRNYHILSLVEEFLLMEINHAIFDETKKQPKQEEQAELDSLLEDTEEMDSLIE